MSQEEKVANSEKVEKAQKALTKESVKKAEPPKGKVTEAKSFVKGVSSEMKKVHWPTRKEVLTYTSVVLVSVVIVGFMIFLVDEAIGLALSVLLRR